MSSFLPSINILLFPFCMVNDQAPPYHPPPYGTDSHDPAAPSPSYELNDLGAPPSTAATRPPLPLPSSSSPSLQSALALDDATIEGCAPKKPPRKSFIPPWLFHSRKGKALIGVILLLLVGLVGAMIWYGVHQSEEKKEEEAQRIDRRVNSYLDVARSTVLPGVRPFFTRPRRLSSDSERRNERARSFFPFPSPLCFTFLLFLFASLSLTVISFVCLFRS